VAFSAIYGNSCYFDGMSKLDQVAYRSKESKGERSVIQNKDYARKSRIERYNSGNL
jgi:hypothetical protein